MHFEFLPTYYNKEFGTGDGDLIPEAATGSMFNVTVDLRFVNS